MRAQEKEVFSFIKEVMKEKLRISYVQLSDHLKDDLGLDSLDVTELSIAIGTKYNLGHKTMDQIFDSTLIIEEIIQKICKKM